MTECYSVKSKHNVPKLFKAAAKILKLVKTNGASIKTQVYNREYKHYNIPALFALVSEANNKWDLLEKIIEKTGIFRNNPKLDPWLGRVLMVDIVRGKCTKSECRPVLYVQQYASTIRECTATDYKPQDKLRYVRVNTLKATVAETIDWFRDVEGWKFLSQSKTYKDQLTLIQEQLLPRSRVFVQDFHIPEILIFPSGHGNYFYQLGLEHLILQDKASCLDAFLLQPERGSTVLDMCAAPGMKTSHIAAIMENTGVIYAVEKDFKRFTTLQDLLWQSGVENVTTINKDVTKVGPGDCPGVEYIVLDPSCSGSGLSDRNDLIDAARLEKLGRMQFTLLRHALTSFPTVKRVLYSTCSTYVQENEQVLQSALDSVQHSFRLTDLKTRLPGWIHFGSDEFTFGSSCIYARPEVDYTTGFFIAVFERNSEEVVCKQELNCSEKRKKEYNQIIDNSIKKKQNNEGLQFVTEKKRKKKKSCGGDYVEFRSSESENAMLQIQSYDVQENQNHLKLNKSNLSSEIKKKRIKINSNNCIDQFNVWKVCVKK